VKGTLVWLGVVLLVAAAPRLTVAGERPSIYDAQDGWFDLSGFLDTAYGFVPLVMPITEPAVGYGALGALVFIDRNAPVDGHFVRPDIAAAVRDAARGSGAEMSGRAGGGGRGRIALAVSSRAEPGSFWWSGRRAQ